MRWCGRRPRVLPSFAAGPERSIRVETAVVGSGTAVTCCGRLESRALKSIRLAGDTVREATSDEVKDLRSENRELKEVVAEITLKNRVLKKSLMGHGEEDAS